MSKKICFPPSGEAVAHIAETSYRHVLEPQERPDYITVLSTYPALEVIIQWAEDSGSIPSDDMETAFISHLADSLIDLYNGRGFSVGFFESRRVVSSRQSAGKLTTTVIRMGVKRLTSGGLVSRAIG